MFEGFKVHISLLYQTTLSFSQRRWACHMASECTNAAKQRLSDLQAPSNQLDPAVKDLSLIHISEPTRPY